MWNSCIKIYDESEYLDGVNITMPMVYALQRYMNVIGHDPRMQVWYSVGTFYRNGVMNMIFYL